MPVKNVTCKYSNYLVDSVIIYFQYADNIMKCFMLVKIRRFKVAHLPYR